MSGQKFDWHHDLFESKTVGLIRVASTGEDFIEYQVHNSKSENSPGAYLLKYPPHTSTDARSQDQS